jgi:hypothetical protein
MSPDKVFILDRWSNDRRLEMAKTQAGKKIVPVSPHTRAKPGQVKKTVPVKPHRRSTPE